jgi:hypothetical protein
MQDFFISHSHSDKVIARRVARHLIAYGLAVWIDERELNLGDALSPTIKEQIRASTTVRERWIRDGQFDALVHSGSGPNKLAYCLGESLRLAHKGWDGVVTTLLSHVRELARSIDRTKVEAAVEHVIAAAMQQSPILKELSHECTSALGAAEWDNWVLAEEMSIYVRSFVMAALTDQNWLRALNEYREKWGVVQRFNVLRSRERK